MFKYKDLDKICKTLCDKYNLEYGSGTGFINGADFSWIIIDVRNGTTKVRTRLVITDWKFDKFIDCSKTIDVTTKSFDEIEKCLIESIKRFKECCVKDRLNEMEQDFEN
ncbi:MAG: hypothetical protein J6T10_06435 [Methanobrevibacter sp.]|nr:hypothetical protein [Methanobrevibacter sp.]